MTTSPYEGKPIEDWQSITDSLLVEYPLSTQEILDVALICWDRLWSSTIGGEIEIHEVELPAPVVGYFFQKLYAHELSKRYPGIWTGEQEKRDKDLVNLVNAKFSTEMKCSGQMGYKLFGNRSYNQDSQEGEKAGKTKSGYYITLNFSGSVITLIRVGWIDQDDWKPQGAETGQAAVLKPEVYQHKLVEISGPYRRSSPIQLLDGVGKKSAVDLSVLGLNTFEDLIAYSGTEEKILKLRKKNAPFLTAL